MVGTDRGDARDLRHEDTESSRRAMGTKIQVEVPSACRGVGQRFGRSSGCLEGLPNRTSTKTREMRVDG